MGFHMWKVGLAVVSLGLVASACGGYSDGSEYSEGMSTADADVIERVESMGAAAVGCANPEGVNYSLAALATASAKELKRWNTVVDFAVVKKNNYSMAGLQEVVDLSTSGRNLCTANGGCTEIQAVLDLQKKEASGKVTFPGGATLQSDIFAQRLVANLKAQKTCNGQPMNLCPAEAHALAFIEKKQGVCEMDYYYKATKAGTADQPLVNASLLKNQLITFGSLAGNPYLAFDAPANMPSIVKIDPGGNTENSTVARSGSGCVKFDGKSTIVTTENIASSCCHVTAAAAISDTRKTTRRSAWNTNTYQCN